MLPDVRAPATWLPADRLGPPAPDALLLELRASAADVARRAIRPGDRKETGSSDPGALPCLPPARAGRTSQRGTSAPGGASTTLHRARHSAAFSRSQTAKGKIKPSDKCIPTWEKGTPSALSVAMLPVSPQAPGAPGSAHLAPGPPAGTPRGRAGTWGSGAAPSRPHGGLGQVGQEGGCFQQSPPSEVVWEAGGDRLGLGQNQCFDLRRRCR